jgi:hypothetical protein
VQEPSNPSAERTLSFPFSVEFVCKRSESLVWMALA